MDSPPITTIFGHDLDIPVFHSLCSLSMSFFFFFQSAGSNFRNILLNI